MSHSSIETWTVWSYLSYPYSYSVLYRYRDLDSIPNQTSHYPLVLHTSHPFILLLHITPDINMSFTPLHASSSSLAMTTPSPPTRSGSESRLLDLPNSASGNRSTMPKTRSPLSPSPYMDIVRVVSFSISPSSSLLLSLVSFDLIGSTTRPQLTCRDVHRDMDPRRVRSNQMQQAYHLHQVVLVNDLGRMQTCGMLDSMD
jgi:hypothetical protein